MSNQTKIEILKCSRCLHLHLEKDRPPLNAFRAWSVRVCPKCKGRITTTIDFNEYQEMVKKEQRYYPALRNLEIRDDYIQDAFSTGTLPVDFLNNIITDCF